ncbi:MAG: hypothetical protein WKG07_16175 [Hymenobacter sp.]
MEVQAKLDALGLHYGTVDLSELEFRQSITPQQHARAARGATAVGRGLAGPAQGRADEK